MTIALIRHGQTDWNRDLRLQGTSDIPLNGTGRGQALDAVQHLADERWDAIVSSPLSRARETAQIIADGLGIELGRSYDDLMERAYGEAEGATAEEISQAWPDRDIPGVEPEDEVAERGIRALAQIAEDFEDRDVIVVCHGTLIRLMLQRLSGQTIEHILNGAISRVVRDADSWTVQTVNGAELEVVDTP